MKHILLVSLKFYQNNGMLGLCLNKIGQLRGGADDFGRIPSSKAFSQTSSSTSETSRTKEFIDEILNDPQISDEQKQPFTTVREDPIFSDAEKIKNDRLRNSLIAKS